MRTLRTLAVCAATLLSPATAQDVFPYEYAVDDLDNGLRLVTVPTEHSGIVSVYIVVAVGSRHEIEPGRSGFAHFFEHMMFRGSENFTSEQQSAIFKKAGADRNAYTTDDYTCYHATFSVGRSGQGARARGGSLPTAEVLGAGIPYRSPGDSRRIQHQRGQSVGQALRSDARRGLRHPHLRAHDDGFPRGHQGHAGPVRLQPRVLRPALPAGDHDVAGGRRGGAGAGLGVGAQVLERLAAR